MSKGILSRKKATIKPPKKFVIFSEGKNTEPEYFEALANGIPKTLIDLIIVKAAGAPKTIGKKALERKKSIKKDRNSFEENDEVWVVFDRDEHDAVKETIDNLSSQDVGVAFSNPCFEVWLILHYTDFDKSIGRHDVQKELEAICEGYSRKNGKKADFKALVSNVEAAEARAAKMNKRRENEGMPLQAPWTSVHNLTSSLRKSCKL